MNRDAMDGQQFPLNPGRLYKTIFPIYPGRTLWVRLPIFRYGLIKCQRFPLCVSATAL